LNQAKKITNASMLVELKAKADRLLAVPKKEGYIAPSVT
jgi:hypothetical protein